MKTIEDLIQENRSRVDQVDLPVGHRERMQARLRQAALGEKKQERLIEKKSHRRIVLWVGSAGAAAAAVVALMLWVLPLATIGDATCEGVMAQNDVLKPQSAMIVDTAAVAKIEKTKPVINNNSSKQSTQNQQSNQQSNQQKSQRKTQRKSQQQQQKQQQITDIRQEIDEVEQYYTAQRDQVIESVKTLIYDLNPTEMARIKRDLTQLTNDFKSDTVPQSLLNGNPNQYIAKTIDRLVAQRETVDRLKQSLTNI